MKLVFFSLTAVLLFSCQKDVIRGRGSIITQTRTMQPFTSVETHFDIAADVTYGLTQEVVITGYENLLSLLDLTVENGVLKLKFNDNTYQYKNVLVKASIKIPVLEKATIHGSNKITVTNFTAGQSFSGLIHGSGSIEVSGSDYHDANLRIQGSGNINAQGLQAKEAVAEVFGSGDIRITVLDKLQSSINGSGNVNYWGNPVVQTTINGSGRVVKR